MKKNIVLSSLRAVVAGMTGLIIGCGGSEIPLAQVDGTVSYVNKPLSGAMVMFIPEKGPMATGITDDSGKFTLKTEGRAGAALGPVKVTVTLPESGITPGMEGVAQQPKTQAERDAYMQKMTEIRQKMADGTMVIKKESLIPEKYGNLNTTDLSFSIKRGENHFPIELK